MVLVHGLSKTLGKSMATRLAHVLHVFQVLSIPVSILIPVSVPISISIPDSVPVPISVPAFPCFPVAHMSAMGPMETT